MNLSILGANQVVPKATVEAIFRGPDGFSLESVN